MYFDRVFRFAFKLLVAPTSDESSVYCSFQAELNTCLWILHHLTVHFPGDNSLNCRCLTWLSSTLIVPAGTHPSFHRGHLPFCRKRCTPRCNRILVNSGEVSLLWVSISALINFISLIVTVRETSILVHLRIILAESVKITDIQLKFLYVRWFS